MHYQVIVLGAGAAGLMCGATSAANGRSTLVVDHAKQAGKKILISGGGRCNFTNTYTSPENFISENPHFCKSALSRYTQWDFIALVEKHGIAWHEKTLGQLFCDDTAKDIVRMLLNECASAGAEVQLRTEIRDYSHSGEHYEVVTSSGTFTADKLVIATGGLSMPKLGATPLGYKIAEHFGHSIIPVRAGLVPFTLHPDDKAAFEPLAGVSLEISASTPLNQFREAMLFTHRGVSGPAILQISSYWKPGDPVVINLLPQQDALSYLSEAKAQHPRQALTTLLQDHLPKRVVATMKAYHQWPDKNIANYADAELQQVAAQLNEWNLHPNGTEGYRTAEVTLGGVNVNEVSSKTMESKRQPGLYFIGEVLDVTGWLGGYNFQWAWSSAVACGRAV